MNERRLLERLTYWESGSTRTGHAQLETLKESVVKYLIRILNTRSGSVQIDPLFGVPDFTNIGSGGLEDGALKNIELEMSRMLNRYERRIDDVSVQVNRERSTAFGFVFDIVFKVKLDQDVSNVKLEATVAGNGQIDIK
jgi:type VI secretion system protein